MCLEIKKGRVPFGIDACRQGFYDYRLLAARLVWKGATMKEATLTKKDTAVVPVLLTPTLVEKMLARRQSVQVVKFRTTCTDCLPNY